MPTLISATENSDVTCIFSERGRNRGRERETILCERNAIHKVIYSTLYKSSRIKRINLNADTAIHIFIHEKSSTST